MYKRQSWRRHARWWRLRWHRCGRLSLPHRRCSAGSWSRGNLWSCTYRRHLLWRLRSRAKHRKRDWLWRSHRAGSRSSRSSSWGCRGCGGAVESAWPRCRLWSATAAGGSCGGHRRHGCSSGSGGGVRGSGGGVHLLAQLREMVCLGSLQLGLVLGSHRPGNTGLFLQQPAVLLQMRGNVLSGEPVNLHHLHSQ